MNKNSTNIFTFANFFIKKFASKNITGAVILLFSFALSAKESLSRNESLTEAAKVTNITNTAPTAFSIIKTDPIIVKKSKSKKQSTYTTQQKIRIENPVPDTTIDRTLNILPGVISRSQSGIGSLVTASSAQSDISGRTKIIVDGIPIVDPLELGINLSQFPRSMVRSIDWESPFVNTMDSFQSSSIFSSTGRIHLHFFNPQFSETSLLPSGSLIGSQPKNAEFSTAIKKSTGDLFYTVGVNAHNTPGNFKYKHPDTNDMKVRENNDSNSLGVAIAMAKKTSESGDVSLYLINNQINRTNPGSLSFPSRDHETDKLLLTGIKYHDDTLIEHKHAVYSSVSINKQQVQTASALTSRDDTHTLGVFSSLGSEIRLLDESSIKIQMDDTYEKISEAYGKFDRNTFGMNLGSEFYFDHFILSPLIRGWSSQDYTSGSAMMTMSTPHEFPIEVALSQGYFTNQTNIIAKRGYDYSGFRLLKNENLLLEKDLVSNLTINYNTKDFMVHWLGFYHFIKDRSQYNTVTFTSGQYINIPKSSLIGTTLFTSYQLLEPVLISTSATVARGWNRDTGSELPYKPRFYGSFESQFNLLGTSQNKNQDILNMAIEEEWKTSVYTDMTNNKRLSPYGLTHLRLDYLPAHFLRNEFSKTYFFIRVSNLWNHGAFVTDGFPIQGRSLSVGLQFM